MAVYGHLHCTSGRPMVCYAVKGRAAINEQYVAVVHGHLYLHEWAPNGLLSVRDGS